MNDLISLSVSSPNFNITTEVSIKFKFYCICLPLTNVGSYLLLFYRSNIASLSYSNLNYDSPSVINLFLITLKKLGNANVSFISNSSSLIEIV